MRATDQYNAVEKFLNPHAVALHPDLIGTVQKRPPSWDRDCPENEYFDSYFDSCPLQFVNNFTDKETTLRVFDSAILSLEIATAPVPEPELVEVAKCQIQKL
jgi:hypothetical protein